MGVIWKGRETRSSPVRLGSRLGQFFLIILLSAGTFVLVEGLSSTILFVKRAFQEGQASLLYYSLAEDRRHTQYDDTLGWVGMPDRYIPDLYGDGKYLRTDSHGFRSDREIDINITQGRIRIVCSGDSFTFGQGVANDRTWCHLLSTKDSRIEPVNMGQRGYGVDQAYLWYMRDGATLDHHVHLFSFIGSDFGRMRSRSRHGYGKPALRLEDGRLMVENTPVPPFRLQRPWMSRLGRAAEGLSSVQMARGLRQRVLGGVGSRTKGDTRVIVKRVFEELERVMRDQDGVLVLVWLPVMGEIEKEATFWRPLVVDLSAELGIPFVDLSVPLRDLLRPKARGLFIGRGETDYVDADGHYSEEGHRWVAGELYHRLADLQEIRALGLENRDREADLP